jgi:hypothetical protein
MNATWCPKRAHSRECFEECEVDHWRAILSAFRLALLIEPSYRLAYIDRVIKSIKGSTSTTKRQTPKHNLILIDILSPLE